MALSKSVDVAGYAWYGWNAKRQGSTLYLVEVTLLQKYK